MTSSINDTIYFDDGVHQYNFIDSLIGSNTSIQSVEAYNRNATLFNANFFSALMADIGGTYPTGGWGGEGSIQESFVNFLIRIPGVRQSDYLLPDGQMLKADTWNEFIESWTKYYRYNVTGTIVGGSLQPGPPISTDNLYKFFLNNYLAPQGSSYDSSTNTLSGDLSSLGNNFNFGGGTDLGTTSVANNPFIQAFNQNFDEILNTLSISIAPAVNAIPPFTTEQFTNIVSAAFTGPVTDYLFTATSTVHHPVDDLPAGSSVTASQLNLLPSYQLVYQQFGPTNGGSTADFEQTLQEFYLAQIQQRGYFNPSHALADWSKTIREKYEFNAVSPNGINSLAGNSSEKVVVINRILALLIQIISSLQNIAIAQSNHLTFRTKFQEAYTGLQKQVPVFLVGDSQGTPFKLRTTGTDESSARNDINSVLNSNLIDNLRTLRGLQEDAAKQEQANINQTTDAVNQQTDMASNFIQQLTTLLNTIFK